MEKSTNKIVLNDTDYLVWRDAGGGTVEIFDIAVKSKREVGVGRQLLELLKKETEAQRISAITRESNHVAHLFYEKTGFGLCAKLPRFYPDEDARMYLYENSL